MDLCEARARFALGENRDALEGLARLIDSYPDDSAARFLQAQLLAACGDVKTARRRLAELVSRTPDYPAALATLARLSFPGPPYREVLAWLHRSLQPRVYLEIGVEHGESLALAARSEIAVGVDPTPRVAPERLPPVAKIFAETSDAFFRRPATSVLGDRAIDLALLDGLHLFEQVLSDFCRAEAWCSPAGTIVLHDCLPIAEAAARRDRCTSFWVGDCWKALDVLLEHRRDLALAVVPTYPSGLVIARRLAPGATGSSAREALHRHLPQLTSQHRERSCPSVLSGWPAHYPVIDNSPEALAAFLASTGATSPG
jgi:hypothetical protein